MTWDTVQQLVRILLQLLAGYLVGQGWITADMGTTLVGSAVSLGGILWWALWQRGRPDTPPAA
jgi:hypothetical protein